MAKVKKFTFCDCKFHPLRDRKEVDQFGFVDMRSAFLNHVIPGDMATDPERYNGVEDGESLLGKSSDVFESIRKASYVESAASAAKAAEAAAASSSAASE